MADDRPGTAPPAAQEDGPMTVNLQVLSPSVGVGSLRFPDLPASTTVRQLKERIRDSLARRPADDHQRLIHRGRLLGRETDTLLEILGEEAVRAGEQQTIHLVVRDAGNPPPAGDPTPRPDAHTRHPPQPGMHRVPSPAMPRPGSAPIGMPPAMAHLPHLHQPQPQIHELQQRISQLQQRDAEFRQLLARQHQHRAAMAHHTQHDGASTAQGSTADTLGGRHSPVGQSLRTVTHEGVGPDGQRYSFRITLNEAIPQSGTAPRPPGAPGPLSAADLHNATHSPDANRALGAMMNAMDRHTTALPPANVAAELAHFNFNTPIQPIQPGVTTPIFPGLSRNASRAATPDVSSGRPLSGGSGIIPPSQPFRPPPTAPGQPEVYILSSPTGPQGLLIHSASEMYATPAARPLHWIPTMYRPVVQPSLPAEAHRPDMQMPQGQGQSPLHVPNPHTQHYQPPAPMMQQQPLPQPLNDAIRRRPVAAAAANAAMPNPAQPAPVPAVNHAGNPGAGALVAAIWPHVWLLIRLAAFTWWFSYTNPSWERWLSLALAFLVVIAINTGILNGMVNQAFHPVREQLEGMIPFADPDRPQQQRQHNQPNQQAGGNAGPATADHHPDPAQAAARLVAQRRTQNGNWLRDQVRRIERAGILFLASFAPGVAERHIQQLEEQERAERRAAEEARSAAAAAAATEAAAAAQQQAAAETAEPAALGGQGQEQMPDEVVGQQPVQAV